MAKTIIDSLVLELGFDTTNLEKGRTVVLDTFKKTKDAAKTTGTGIEDGAKKSGDYITRLRNNVLGLFAVFTAGRGIKDFVSDVTSSDAALGRFAKTVGQSAESIAQWRGAGRLMGVEAGDIDSTFSTLSSNFQQFALTGDSTIVPWFRALGMTMTNADGSMKDIGQMLLELAQRFQGMDQAKATAFMHNMGISPGMINLILRGPDAIQKLIDKQRVLAKAQADDAAAAAARQEAWQDFLSQAEAIGTMLLTSLTPALIAVTNAAKAFSAWGERHPEIMGAAFAALTGVVVALSAALTALFVGSTFTAIASGFGILISLAKGLMLGLAVLTETALPALSEAFFSLGLAIEATPIGWVITAIAALAVVGYELYKHWDTIAKWWHSLWGGIGDDAERGSSRARDAANKLQHQRDGKAPAPSGPQAQADIDKLVKLGWTRSQATGIVANIQAESGGKTDAVGDNGAAFGLGQWHYDRQQAFAGWAGHSIKTATRDEQLAFINYELRSSERRAGDALARTSTAEAAADVVSRLYERPANTAGASAARQAIATALGKAPAGNNNIPTGQLAAAFTAHNNNSTTNHASSEVNIGTMTIQSAAKDGVGLARDFRGALAQDMKVPQANSGAG